MVSLTEAAAAAAGGQHELLDLYAHVLSEQNGKRIRLTKGSPQVFRLFEVSGMVDQLPFTSGD